MSLTAKQRILVTAHAVEINRSHWVDLGALVMGTVFTHRMDPSVSWWIDAVYTAGVLFLVVRAFRRFLPTLVFARFVNRGLTYEQVKSIRYRLGQYQVPRSQWPGLTRPEIYLELQLIVAHNGYARRLAESEARDRFRHLLLHTPLPVTSPAEAQSKLNQAIERRRDDVLKELEQAASNMLFPPPAAKEPPQAGIVTIIDAGAANDAPA